MSENCKELDAFRSPEPMFDTGRMPEPGDLVPDRRYGPTAVRVVAPTTCPRGHDITRPYSVQVSWVRCRCPTASTVGGHHTWLCWECMERVYGPPCSDEDARVPP